MELDTILNNVDVFSFWFWLSAITGLFITAILLDKLKTFFFKLKYKNNLPPFEGGLLPYFGLVFSFGKHPLQVATDLYHKHGEVFTIKVLGERLTFLASPEAHGPFLSGNDNDLDQNEPYKFAVPLFGKGVVYDVDLNTRNQQLKFMRGSLKTEKMKVYVDLIIQETEQFFFERFKDEGVIDLRNELSELIILTASRCLMGNEIRERMFAEVSRLFHVLDSGLKPISVFFPYLPIPAHKRRDEAREQMIELFASVIKERRSHPDIIHNDVLQVFMDAEYTDGRKLSEAEIAGLMIALLFAGQHTSSITSSWTGFHILNNKEFFLPKIIDEQKRVLSNNNGKLNYDVLQQMDYLHRCIKETLRLTPPLIFVMRKLTVDMPICNYTVPAGDTLFLSPALSGRLESVYSNPDQYDPDRYIPPREEDKKKPFSYVGFGGGRHGCMGEVFAYLQIKTIWSVLFRNYDLEMVGEFPKQDFSSMVVGPTQPCLIRYKKLAHPIA